MSQLPFSFIFVELGPSKSTVKAAALQVRHRYPEAPIYVISDQKHLFLKMYKIELVDAARLKKSDLWKSFLGNSELNSDWRKGFWLKTSERIFALDAFIRSESLQNTIHMENDITLLCGERELNSLRGKNLRVAFPFESTDLGCLSILYCDAPASIHELAQKFVETSALNPKLSEMRILGKIRRENQELITVLPTIPYSSFPQYLKPHENSKFVDNSILWENFSEYNFLFDATAYGYFLGGEDPRNTYFRYQLGTALATSPINISDLNWNIKGSPGEPELWVEDKESGQEIQLLNLHIHSKDMKTDDNGLRKWLQERVNFANSKSWPPSPFAARAFARALRDKGDRRTAIYGVLKEIRKFKMKS